MKPFVYTPSSEQGRTTYVCMWLIIICPWSLRCRNLVLTLSLLKTQKSRFWVMLFFLRTIFFLHIHDTQSFVFDAARLQCGSHTFVFQFEKPYLHKPMCLKLEVIYFILGVISFVTIYL